MSTMRERLAYIEAERARIRQMGGPDKVQRQHERGKLTARERLARFFDDGEYFEIGIHGTQMGSADPTDKPPADAVICGWGKVCGRHVCAAAYDFTVKGGSIGMVGETKVSRLRELALRCRMPMVWFIDSAGARIDPKSAGSGDFLSLFAGTGHLFREQVIMSGVVPMVAAMVGPGAAGTAYIPGLADFVPMVRDRGSMALGGPPLVKAVTGQEISEQELGGSKVHCEVSGVGDLEVPDEQACLDVIKDYLSYMPQHCEERPPIVPCNDPIDRREEALLDVVPDNPRQAYDMYDVLRLVVDHGRFLDIKPRWARNIITCLARIGGYPVGIVANNPRVLGGILDVHSADKAAHFMQICDAFNIPLVFLMDVPGFMVGSKVEHEGIIRHGAKMLHIMAAATVPKLTVVVRKGYGAGYYVMAGRAYEPDLLVAWPGAEISVMGAEGMVGIAGRKLFGDQEPPPEAKAQMVAMLQKHIDILRVAGWGLIDDVIDPRDTRRLLALSLQMSWNRKVERPYRKRGIIPV
ncbi:MAG: acyl-CoA carboxylase subunit beta [Myxococcales bacterium]|nr:acyl-CoA carboxylase subunit beta [Myxococcota bacterium]MDW8280265.1 acyl-CoA carboxylase subunit beta [Myxococcales bacterium]